MMHRHLSSWRKRSPPLFRIAIVISLICGCLASFTGGAFSATWSTTDLKTNAALPSGTTAWNSVTVTWQVGNYLSDGLQIYGLLCIPSSLPAPYPVAIVNHGLASLTPPFPGIQQVEWTGCVEMAGNGWLTAISAYRGEFVNQLPAPYASFSATSAGAVELCLGEVDDVVNLLSAVTAMPNANASQVLMWGHSHGACITERAIEKGATVAVAVSLDGPTDFTTWSNNPFPLPAAQHARSSAWPANNPSALTQTKFLRIQAEGDTTVTPDQACELASMLPGSVNYYINSAVTPYGVYYASPKECAAYPMPWVNAPVGPNGGQVLPDERGTWLSPTLLMYSGLDHVTIMGKSWAEQASFVNVIATNGGWPASLPSEFIQLDSE
jgi:hypothetical protein